MTDGTGTLIRAFDLTPPTDEELRALAANLDDDERRVLLNHGTEAPFCGVFLDEKREGIFTCRLCGLPLFTGGTKFESGTGWPSIYRSDQSANRRDRSVSRPKSTRSRSTPAACAAGEASAMSDAPK